MGQVLFWPRLPGLLIAPLWLTSLLYVRLTAINSMCPVPGSTPASISAVGLLPVGSIFSMLCLADAWALTSSEV